MTSTLVCMSNQIDELSQDVEMLQAKLGIAAGRAQEVDGHLDWISKERCVCPQFCPFHEKIRMAKDQLKKIYE